MGVRRAEEDDFAEFAASTWRSLVRAATLMGARGTAAEDVAQEALVKAYRSWAKIKRSQFPRAYVHRILINHMRSASRKRAVREVFMSDLAGHPVDDARTHDEPADRVAERDLVRAALAQLSEGQRQAIVLRYYCQFTEAEISEVLGVAAGTVKSRLSRGLESLSNMPELLEDQEERDGCVP